MWPLYPYTQHQVALEAGSTPLFVWLQVEFDDLPGSNYASKSHEQRLTFWEKTKRLAHGTLVTLLWLAPDGCSSEHMVFGTVSVRDAQDLAAGQGRKSRLGIGWVKE